MGEGGGGGAKSRVLLGVSVLSLPVWLLSVVLARRCCVCQCPVGYIRLSTFLMLSCVYFRN